MTIHPDDPAPQETAPSAPPPAAAPFRLPADYYSDPSNQRRPLFPGGVVAGCGIAAVILLVILFAGAAAISGGGKSGGGFMATVLSMMHRELDGMFAADVPPEDRRAFDAEFDALSKNLGDGRIAMSSLQDLVRQVREASADQRLTRNEVESLTRQIHALNSAPPPRPARER